MADPVLEAVLNLSRFHREHEKYYSQQPREQAVTLQRHARALTALADRWSAGPRRPQSTAVPFAGSEDLNDPVALQLDGILFMEGEGEPAEILAIEKALDDVGEQSAATGEWLSSAMESTWAAALTLIEYDELTDLLGERHRIIANGWQAASMTSLVGRLLHRSVEILHQIDFTPSALRADLDGRCVTPRRLYSSAELVNRAADLLSDSAGLVHENERRWRVFRARVQALADEGSR